MRSAKHTFLFTEGLWIAKGQYTGESGVSVPAEGKSKITQQKSLWMIEAFMRLQQEDVTEIRQVYEIVPFRSGATTTNWKSRNPLWGVLFGRFIIVEDSIISTYQSESSEYSGVEILWQENENLYQSRGFAVRGDKILSSWAVSLEKKGKS